MRGCTEAHQSAVSSLEWTRTATQIELGHATDCWLDDAVPAPTQADDVPNQAPEQNDVDAVPEHEQKDGPEPPRKAPRVHKDASTHTAWTCPTLRPGDLVKKSMPKTLPDTWDVFRVVSVEEDGRVSADIEIFEDAYSGVGLTEDAHHFRHLTDDEIRTRSTDFASRWDPGRNSGEHGQSASMEGGGDRGRAQAGRRERSYP